MIFIEGEAIAMAQLLKAYPIIKEYIGRKIASGDWMGINLGEV